MWNQVIGLGVAGNFAGHLEQAGESADFVDVVVADQNAPKGIFPFYLPGGAAEGLGAAALYQMPISADRIRLHSLDENHQIEPEVAILCEVTYASGQVTSLTPRFAMAHNDCSIRRPGARKISEKKNWGPESKGTSTQRIAIDRFSADGVLGTYRLACFLRRDGHLHAYGVDSPVNGYSYGYEQLLEWLIRTMNTQVDTGPLEHISGLIKAADYPGHALISIGATRYTDFGETHFLQPGDESIVVLYDGAQYTPSAVPELLNSDLPSNPIGLSVLSQTVVAP